MSKRIKMTKEQIDEYVKEFRKTLETAKGDDGKITISKTLDAVNEKATVFFMPIAWTKMTMLLMSSNKELAWHGVAYRCSDDDGNVIPNEYVITDIIVYPQQVTGTTVEADDDKYDAWLMGLDKDTFDGIRMQGHSHVNMATSPSGTDLTWNNKILQTVRDDMFYIFMIWNKSLSRNIKIYDVENNIFFDNDDVSVGYLDDDGRALDTFLEEANKLIVSKTYTSSTATTASNTVTIDTKDKSKPRESKKETNKFSYGAYDYDADDYMYTGYYSRYGWRDWD